jgi:hypothetical protein
VQSTKPGEIAGSQPKRLSITIFDSENFLKDRTKIYSDVKKRNRI